MPVRQGRVAHGYARGQSIVRTISAELESARIEHGLSYADLGRAVGISGAQAARICRASSGFDSFLRITAMFAAVGRQLACRSYPAGPAIRDAAHDALLARFRARLDVSVRWRLEDPVIAARDRALPGPVDLRAWDATVSGDGWTFGVEAETRLSDLQALLRRLALKQRDGHVDGLLLVVNDTAHNRQVVAEGFQYLRVEFPGSARRAMRALRRGLKPPENALLTL